jgi:ribosome-binding factor A
MSDKREIQVKETIAHLAGDFLAREAGPQSLITVTRAESTSDLKNVTVFISVIPVSEEKKALAFCKRERSAFRLYLRDKSALHFPPTIDFELDFGEKNRQRIDDLTRPNA